MDYLSASMEPTNWSQTVWKRNSINGTPIFYGALMKKIAINNKKII
jgi:hypothetical protein